MLGPVILARALTRRRYRDSYGNLWQYHPRSDYHSKVACWGALFDLLFVCGLLRRHAEAGNVAFGINHEMADFRMDRPKYLDLVVCTPGGGALKRQRSFAALTAEYDIDLTSQERRDLDSLPPLMEAPVGVVHLALEAKATMTAHVKALPRLYDELTSSHVCIHGASSRAIAAGLAIVNTSTTFVSPDNNRRSLSDGPPRINIHAQPKDAVRTIEKVRQIARRTNVDERGFDALGIIAINMRNDGSEVRVISEPPAPDTADIFHYQSMIRRAAQLYEGRFPHA